MSSAAEPGRPGGEVGLQHVVPGGQRVGGGGGQVTRGREHRIRGAAGAFGAGAGSRRLPAAPARRRRPRGPARPGAPGRVPEQGCGDHHPGAKAGAMVMGHPDCLDSEHQVNGGGQQLHDRLAAGLFGSAACPLRVEEGVPAEGHDHSSDGFRPC